MYLHCDPCNATAPREHVMWHAAQLDRVTPVPASATRAVRRRKRVRPNWRGILGTALLSALITGVGMTALYTVTDPAPTCDEAITAWTTAEAAQGTDTVSYASVREEASRKHAEYILACFPER